MKTRKDFTAGKVTYKDYYGQFVNSSTKARVLAEFTLEELLASRDGHLNDLELKRWDRIAGGVSSQLCAGALRQAGDIPSLGSAVCILKESALQIIEPERVKRCA